MAMAMVSPHMPLAAQEAPHRPEFHAVSPLPAALTPDAPPRPPSAPAVAESGPTPYLFGIAGGVAGLFVGKWAMTRGCEENCSQQALLGGLVGILGGAALGYVIGGGELVPPPRR